MNKAFNIKNLTSLPHAPKSRCLWANASIVLMALLAGCDGNSVDMGGENQPLSEISFADDELAACVMSTGHTMSGDITDLNCAQPISDLSGIEQLPNLESLTMQAGSTGVTDFSGLPQLKELFLNGDNPDLANLQEIIFGSSNSIERLGIYNYSLTMINMDNLTNLREFTAANVKLKTLDFTYNIKLGAIYIYIAPELTTIDTSNLLELNELSLTTTNIEAINLTYNNKLGRLTLIDIPKLLSLDISQNAMLTGIYVERTALEDIIFGAPNSLAYVNLNDNNLTNIDITQLSQVEWLDLSDNSLESIDVSYNTALERLELQRNNLSDIDLSNNSELDLVYLHDNNIDCETGKRIKAEAAAPDEISLFNFGEECTAD